MFGQVRKPGGGTTSMKAGSSAHSHEAITPSDATGFTGGTCTGIYVGTGGNITCVVDGVAVLYTAVPQGTILPVEASRVNATGTTASNLVAMFG